jgi:hypothetical protein
MRGLHKTYKKFREQRQLLHDALETVDDNSVKKLRNYVFSLYNTEEFIAERKIVSMNTRTDLELKGGMLFVVVDLVIDVTPVPSKNKRFVVAVKKTRESFPIYVEVTQEIMDGAFGPE